MKIKTDTRIIDDLIIQEQAVFDDLDFKQSAFQSVINTQEQKVREALIQLGWKPPAKKAGSKQEYFDDRMVRRVICAANRFPDGLILCGARHWDSVMCAQATALGIKGGNEEQGFIDQYGVFMDRKEAMQVAKDAGQAIDIRFGCGGDELTLYSEGLY